MMRSNSSPYCQTNLARRGAAAVELGLTLPLLVTVALGAVDLGRFAYSYIIVTNAARAGAGYGCVNPFTQATRPLWEAGIRQAVADEMMPLSGFDPAKLNVNVSSTTESDGLTRVRVEVSYLHQSCVDWPYLPTAVNLQRAVELRGIR